MNDDVDFGVTREMNLDEYVRQLPEIHLARREYDELVRRASEQVERDAGATSCST
jgi:hypothetical protein